jgi:sigma-B regulation protein RsbU (phosphoserine phosphatase)
MAPLVRRLAEFVNDLQQIDRVAGRGEAILDCFTRHTTFVSGALYLREARDSKLCLAAKTEHFVAPEIFDEDVPTDLRASAGQVVVPLRCGRDSLGVVKLTGDAKPSEEDLEVLRAAAAFAGTLIANHRLTQEMREGDFQLKYRLWELESLYDIGLSIAGTLNIDELADEVLFRMISLINARRAALFLRDGDSFKVYRSFGEVDLDRDALRKLQSDGAPMTLWSGTTVAVPIRGNNAIIGVLAAADRETRDGIGPFEENELRLLSLFANQVGIALENSRLHREALEKQVMERELELAATIQRDILPKSIPIVERIDVAALSRPARQVGGDYHAFFDRDGVLSMLVADVAGKSMPAALLVSALHAAVQLLFAEGREIGDIATELNMHIHRWSAENKFITAILASIDRDAQTIEFVNAGHNPGYLLVGGRLETLKSHGLPIGIISQSKYVSQTRPFPRGSAVVLYSDGITEAENIADEEFGNDRLEELLRERVNDSPAALRDQIAAAVDAFTGTAPQKDDQTLVIARLA